MASNTNTNTNTSTQIPNSGNLFDIMLDMTQSASRLYDVVVKNKLSSKAFGKEMSMYVKNMSTILTSLNRMLVKMSKQDWKAVVDIDLKPVNDILVSMTEISTSIAAINMSTMMTASLRLLVMDRFIKHFNLFLTLLAYRTMGKTGMYSTANAVLTLISRAARLLADTVDAISRINFFVAFRARRGIDHLYKLLFGDPMKGRRGLMDIFLVLAGNEPARLGQNNLVTRKMMLDSLISLKLMVMGLRDITLVLAVIALVTPVLPIAWVGVKLLNSILNTIVHMYGSISDPKDRKNIALGSLVILAVTTSLLTFVTAMVLIGAAVVLGWKVMMAGLLGITVTVFTIYLILEFLKNHAKDVGAGGLVMVALCGAMLLAAVSLLVLSQIDFGADLLKSAGTMILVIAAFAGIAVLLGLLTSTGVFVIGLIALVALAGVMLVVAASMLIVALALQAIETMQLSDDVLLKVLRPVGEMLHYMMQNFSVFNPITLGFALIGVVMCTGIVVLSMFMAIAVWVIDKITGKWNADEMTQILVSVYAPVKGLGDYFNENRKVFNVVTLALMAVKVGLVLPVIVMSTVMAILTWTIAKITKGVNWDEANENIRSMFGVFIGEGGVIEQINEIRTIDIARASGKMLLLNPMITAVGRMAKVISRVAKLQIPDKYDAHGNAVSYHTVTPAEFKQAATNVATLTEFFVKVICGGTTADGTTYAGCLNELEQVKRKHAKGMKRLADIVGSVGDMADTISKFATMTIPDTTKGWDSENGRWKSWRLMGKEDFTSATANIEKVAMFFVDTLCGKGGETGLAQKVYDKFKEFKKSEVFGTFKTVIDIIAGMGNTVRDFANMVMPDPTSEWDAANGRYKKYVTMKPDDYTKAVENISKLTTTLIESLTGDEITAAMKRIGKSSRKQMKHVFDTVKDYTAVVGDIVTVYEKTSAVSDPDGISRTLTSMLSTLTTSISDWDLSGDTGKKCAYLKSVADTIVRMNESMSNVDNVQKGLRAYGDFVKVVNNSKLDNLKYAYSLMKAMEQITKNLKGNFDKLADTLNEDIIEQLKRIAEYLDDINNRGVRTGAGSNAVGGAAVAPVPVQGADAKKETESKTRKPKDNVYDADELHRLLDGIEVTLKDITRDDATGYLKVKTR